LGQVQDFPLANIAEAQAGAVNTRYMTPVRTKNFVDAYLIPLLDAHKADLNNPHSTTKAQVGLGSVQNYGIATQAEAEAGVVANKYMTPLQTKQAIAALATTGLTSHLQDFNNPHSTTKAQVGLPLVENYPIASVAEAESASRNDRYMTPLMTAKQIQVLVKDSMDLHINATNNPHMVNKAQVGLGSVLNYGIATQAEAEAGALNTSYMTPLMTRKAIEAIATGSIGAHLADDQNPHATTKAQVGLGSVQNFPLANTTEAQEGTSNARYMTPLLVKQAIDAQVSGGIGNHLADKNNPHGVTAAQVGAPTVAAMNTALLGKLDATAKAADSALLDGHTYQQILDASAGLTAADSERLQGKTLSEVLAAAKLQTAPDSTLHEGKTVAQIVDLASDQVEKQDVAVQYHFSEMTNDGVNWLELGRSNYLPTDEAEDLVFLISGGMRTDDIPENQPTLLARLGYKGDTAEVTLLSGGVIPQFEIHRQPLAGGFGALWLKSSVGATPITVTVLSGKKFVQYDLAQDPGPTAPAGVVKVTINRSASYTESNTLAVQEQVSVAANTWKEYNLVTLLGAANVAAHNPAGAVVRVRALDTVVGSPTKDMLVDADGMTTVAIVTGATPKVRILNSFDSAQTLNIRIEVPRN
jgi:hypothetical protein